MKTSYWIAVVVIIAVLGIGLFLMKGQSTSPSTPSVETQTTPSIEAASPEASASTMISEENMVTLSADGYSPATLNIKVGDKVTWVNKSGVAATVNSDPHPTHTAYPPLNLGNFANGDMISLTFDKVGTYGYHNHLNPTQKGTIIVE